MTTTPTLAVPTLRRRFDSCGYPSFNSGTFEFDGRKYRIVVLSPDSDDRYEIHGLHFHDMSAGGKDFHLFDAFWGDDTTIPFLRRWEDFMFSSAPYTAHDNTTKAIDLTPRGLELVNEVLTKRHEVKAWSKEYKARVDEKLCVVKAKQAASGTKKWKPKSQPVKASHA